MLIFVKLVEFCEMVNFVQLQLYKQYASTELANHLYILIHMVNI